MADVTLPPVQPADDGWQHRRATDGGNSEPVHHRRKMDVLLSSTKVQLGILLTAITVIGGAVAIGYSLRDFTKTVEGSDKVNTEQWEAINKNTQNINAMGGQMEVVVSLLREVRCVVNADTPAEQEQCQTEEAQRRLDALRSSTRR